MNWYFGFSILNKSVGHRRFHFTNDDISEFVGTYSTFLEFISALYHSSFYELWFMSHITQSKILHPLEFMNNQYQANRVKSLQTLKVISLQFLSKNKYKWAKIIFKFHWALLPYLEMEKVLFQSCNAPGREKTAMFKNLLHYLSFLRVYNREHHQFIERLTPTQQLGDQLLNMLTLIQTSLKRSMKMQDI